MISNGFGLSQQPGTKTSKTLSLSPLVYLSGIYRVNVYREYIKNIYARYNVYITFIYIYIYPGGLRPRPPRWELWCTAQGNSETLCSNRLIFTQGRPESAAKNDSA